MIISLRTGLFRYSKRWLRYRVNLLIRKKHQDLFQPPLKAGIVRIREYAFDRKGWWLILIGVTITFIIGGLINISFLNIIDLKSSTARILVDQRTGNIAAITAITLVVVGFLINNLAVKESYAYRLLFKHSYLYPIIYLTLSTIGCFFIVSTLRDELNESQFTNTVLAGTYLSLIILLLIGALFRTIIQFTDDKKIGDLLHNELMTEAKQNIKDILMKNYSNELYKEEMINKGAKEYDWRESIGPPGTSKGIKVLSEDNIAELKKKERYIYDLNLNSLKKYILKKQKQQAKVTFQDLSINKVITEYDNYLWQNDSPNTSREKRSLRKSLLLRKLKDTEGDKESVRKYFDHKLEKLVSENKYRNLEDLLNSYYELYELQMNHLS